MKEPIRMGTLPSRILSRPARRGWAFLCVSLLCAAPAFPQATFDLGITLESNDFPDLDEKGVIQGKTGQEFEVTGNLTLKTAGIDGDQGPQGWSIGVRNEMLEILGTTFAGTAADTKENGGFFNEGFRVFQIINPDKNMGKMGMVSAVVLSLTEGTTIPANTTQLIGRNRYRATIGDVQKTGSIRFEDGLVGAGKAVPNNITQGVDTVIPTKGERLLTIAPEGPPPSETNCTDGKDDDADGKTDCADTDCAGNAACKEVCDDKADNDFDGKTDCADTDCAASPACKEICDDKADNDGDSKVDCDDADCKGTPACDTGTGGYDLVLTTPESTREGPLAIAKYAPGEKFIMTTFIELHGGPEPPERAVQGWSISIAHDTKEFDITSGGGFPTIQGTDAAAVFSEGFQKTQVVDPAKNDGKGGFISAVVLSLQGGVALDPTKNQSIARSEYTVSSSVTTADYPLSIMFMDNLVGAGKAVPNLLSAVETLPIESMVHLEIQSKGLVTPKRFRRGDANDDAKVNIADPIWIINELVRSGPMTACRSAADANDDGIVDLSDSMFIIQFQFLRGPTPPAPFPACGEDTTADGLSCPDGSATGCPSA